MFKINSILAILSDGKLHRIEELRMNIRVDDFEMQQVLAFLHMFDFIEIVDDEKVRTKKIFRRLIAQRIVQ